MVRNGAWWTFFAGCLSAFLAGTAYAFGSWSPAVKGIFQYSQANIGSLTLAKDIGLFVSMDAGLLTTRCGAHWSLGVACVMLATSSLIIWAALKSGECNLVVMIATFWLFGHSLGYADNAGIATSVKNFPRQKGNAVGLMKALEGITAAVMNTMFYSFFTGDTNELINFPLIQVLLAVTTCIFGVPIMVTTNAVAEESNSVLSKKFSVLTVGLLFYIGFCAAVGYTKTYNLVTFVVTVAGLLSIILLVWPIGSTTVEEPSVASDQGPQAEGPSAASVQLTAGGSARPDLPAREMLKTLDFYLCFLSYIVMMGSGMSFANNLAQIVKAVDNDAQANAATTVTIFSVFNATGRVFYGFGSDLMRGRIDRPWILSSCGFFMVVGMITLATMGEPMLQITAAIMGLANGGIYALQAVVIEELFGPRDLPLKYSCCYIAGCLGSLIFSDLMASSFYDAAARKEGQKVCLGSECFNTTFYVTAVCSSVAWLSLSILAIRSRRTYVQVNAALGQ